MVSSGSALLLAGHARGDARAIAGGAPAARAALTIAPDRDPGAPVGGAALGARAPEPRAARGLELSGFLGVGTFGDSELGNSWDPEQVPGTAPLAGVRVGWRALPALVRRGWLALSLGAEGELTFAAASTGTGVARAAYFAPVLGWRAHALLRQRAGRGAVHAVLGAGGATVASRSPYMARETDPIAYLGVGATYALRSGWQLRVDARQGLMPGRAREVTRVSEVHAGLAVALGGPPPAAARPPLDEPDPIAAADRDGDGIPDLVDRCPDLAAPDAELRDAPAPAGPGGGRGALGCPAPDLDRDGVRGRADACPEAPEDRDGFEDADGCPDPDNDGDGRADREDRCPDAAEVRNGYADGDGCPDALPDAVARGLAAASAARFEPARARVTAAAAAELRAALAALEAVPELRVVITAAPDRAGAVAVTLAKRRAEAVKWHLVDQGIAADRIATATGPVTAPGAATPVITLAPAR